MALIHEYLVGLALRLYPGDSIVLLDYGCGRGEMVQYAGERGVDAFGVEEFYGGGNAKSAVEAAGLLDKRVFSLSEGRIPFDDQHFDVVLSNQVFEHIDDFALPLEEINRVMKPGAVFVNAFPSRGVWREGHIGVPFVHWMKPNTRRRWWYTYLWRAVGFGYHKERAAPARWVDIYLDWIDQWTFYKPEAEVMRALSRHFSAEDYAGDYLNFRLRKSRRLAWLRPLFSAKWLEGATTRLCVRLSGHVYVLRKHSG